MFRTAELGQKVSNSEYKKREPEMRRDLLDVQFELRQLAKFPVIIVFAGVDGAGKSESVNLLNAWMDPRWLLNHAYGEPSSEEAERPEFWRYWRDQPPKGQIGLFLSSWYSRPTTQRVHNQCDEAVFNEMLDRIISFERALSDDGALIIKFWLHLSKDAQKKRFKKLEKDPLSSWRVTQKDWDNWRIFGRFEETAENVIMRTSTGNAPWSIIEGADDNFRSLAVGEIIRDEIRKRICADEAATQQRVAATDKSTNETITTPGVTQLTTVLSTLDMSLTLDNNDYDKQIQHWQARLNELQRKAYKKGISTLLLFEGPDAAGKGGAIRRITAALDARHYQVIPVAAPTQDERAQHYLWRFWRHVPRAGRVRIYDRSWYGRVLVERIEGFACEVEWRRAYAEINDFEQQLIACNIVLVKYWLHISADEQLKRFNERELTEYKSWKLTDEDWRNREKWSDYEYAINDAIERTSTRQAPWTLIEGNDKRYARVKIIKTMCEAMEAGLKHKATDWK